MLLCKKAGDRCIKVMALGKIEVYDWSKFSVFAKHGAMKTHQICMLPEDEIGSEEIDGDVNAECFEKSGKRLPQKTLDATS